MMDYMKAVNMKSMALNYRLDNMSDILKGVLDDIYVASRHGGIKIDKKLLEISEFDIETLVLMGYKVREYEVFKDLGKNTKRSLIIEWGR